MKIIAKVISLLLLIILCSCDSKSNDPIEICIDAKIELYIEKELKPYCSTLSTNEKFIKELAKRLIDKLSPNDILKQETINFSKALIQQHNERAKFCSNQTISNFKKLDIKDTSRPEYAILRGNFFPLNFRNQCLEKFSE